MLRRIQTWNENGTAQFKPSRAYGGPDTGLEYHSNIIITVVQLQIDRTVVPNHSKTDCVAIGNVER